MQLSQLRERVAASGAPSIYEQRLRAVLDVIQRYLPQDGIDMDTAMGEIIGLVDPWPDDVMASGPLRRLHAAATAALPQLCDTSTRGLREADELRAALQEAAGAPGVAPSQGGFDALAERLDMVLWTVREFAVLHHGDKHSIAIQAEKALNDLRAFCRAPYGAQGTAPGESREEDIGGSAVLPAGTEQPLKIGPDGTFLWDGRTPFSPSAVCPPDVQDGGNG